MDGAGGQGRRVIALAARVTDAKIVLRMLVQFSAAIPSSLAVASRQGEVALEYLVGAAADFDVGTVAVEGLIPLARSLLLLKWPAAIISAARRLI